MTDGIAILSRLWREGRRPLSAKGTEENFCALVLMHPLPEVDRWASAALQALARAHRRKFPDLVELAISGSSGKTSTKELCAAILEQRWPERVLKTVGNTNNHYGVPRNLLRLTSETAAAVIEMGSNHPGEIAQLVALTSPG